MPTPVLPGAVPVRPIETEDGWSRYILFGNNVINGSVVTNKYGGNVLFPQYSNAVLKANEIEVAAPIVIWRPQPDAPFVLRQPQGIPEIAEFDHNLNLMRFPKLPHYSVVVHQNVNGKNGIVVISQCRTHPQRIYLNNSSPIFVQLNNCAGHLCDHRGIVELWVRVVA